MSISKRRAQKSLNHSSLSEVSQSENLRDVTFFRNDVLVDINNLQIPIEPRSSKKEPSEPSTSKKKIQAKKQYIRECGCLSKEREADKSKENKALNYAGLSKMVEERNCVIKTQEKQIESYKVNLEKIKKQLQISKIEHERKKLEDLAALKRQEKENELNISELQTLRVGMRQLKTKIQTLQLQKEHCVKKSNEYLQQNQDLTVKLTSLKQQLAQRSLDERSLADLKHELSIMQCQAQAYKQLQIQKSALEERCHNFQLRINDYIIRYNEAQSDHNETQIKYYRAQKQIDDLRMRGEEAEAEARGLRRVLEEERRQWADLAEKWRARIAKLEETARAERVGDAKGALGDLQERCVGLETRAKLEVKIEQQNCEIANLSNRLAEISSQNQKERKELEEYILQVSQLKKNIANTLKSEQQKTAQISESQASISRLLQQLKCLEIELGECKKQHESQKYQYELEAKEKQTQIQRINNQFTQKTKQLETKLQSFRLSNSILNQELSQKQSLIRTIESRNTDQTIQLTELKQSTQALRSELADTLDQLHLLASENSTLHAAHDQQSAQVVLKLNSLERSLSRSQQSEQALVLSISHKEQQIARLQGIVGSANLELLQIRGLVQQYRQQLQDQEAALTEYQLKCNSLDNFAKENDASLRKHIKQAQQTMVRLKSLECSLAQTLQSEHSLSRTIVQKTEQMHRLETIVTTTNVELKQIRAVVQEYRGQLAQNEAAIAQYQRRCQILANTAKDSQIMLQSGVRLYRGKYEQAFNKSIELCEKVRGLQDHNNELASRLAEAANNIEQKQIELGRLRQDRTQIIIEYESRVQKQSAEANRLTDEGQKMQEIIHNLTAKLRDCEIHSKEQEDKRVFLTEEIKRLRQHHQASLFEAKNFHTKQLEMAVATIRASCNQALELQHLRAQKALRAESQKNQALSQNIEQLSCQLANKQRLLQQNYQIICRKQKELEQVSNFRNSVENQEMRRTKEHNLKLSQQVEQVTRQLSVTLHEMNSLCQERQNTQSSLMAMEKEVQSSSLRIATLSNELNAARISSAQQSEEHSRALIQLRCQAGCYEDRIRQQQQELSTWASRYEGLDKEFKRVQTECNRVSRGYLEQSCRKDKQNSREMDSCRAQIRVLQEENQNLQKIMDRELNKRKIIIEELIQEKKTLYEQIGHH